MLERIVKNPMTRKRFLRFKAIKRAWFSFWILLTIYIVSLGSELICNEVPLYVHFNGKTYFPVFSFYPEDEFTGSGKKTRPDYKKIERMPVFQNNPDNTMIFPIIPFGPYEIVDPEFIPVSDNVILVFEPVPQVGSVDITEDYSIVNARSIGPFLEKQDRELKKRNLLELLELPDSFKAKIQKRFSNEDAPFTSIETDISGGEKVEISLSTYHSRDYPPRRVRLTFRQVETENRSVMKIIFDEHSEIIRDKAGLWENIPAPQKTLLMDGVHKRHTQPVDGIRVVIDDVYYVVSAEKEDVRFPFRPVEGHPLGIDGAGRDVLARILYGLRTSLTFGLMLVIAAMIIGIIVGAVQGYYGGVIDITGQRLIEIWNALPFLYVMILMGSVIGRSFTLLLICYGLFNWIGISYYIRAEFLRLRKFPFVEAAKCIGIPTRKIIFRHILPNALIPVITFFPFQLVGAIGALAALDYLGFGLPPPMPSWGELLSQAQQYRWAWWLILYPSLSLFTVMLLGVFVGEGVRNAYDPKQFSKIE